MMVSQTLAILSGIFAFALASAQSAESCSGEFCSDELSAWSSLLQTTVARHDEGEHKNNELVYESEATVQDKRALDAQIILREHNIVRCMHGADPLVWDDSMASHGKSWADNIHYSGMAHGGMDFDGIHVGQNLAGSCSSGDVTGSEKKSVDQWMTEESYNGGHYTQVVWKGSKKLGCGMWCGPDLGMNCCMVVCNYYPAGNNGESASNVEVRVKERSQCESDSGDGGSTPQSPAPPPAPSTGGWAPAPASGWAPAPATATSGGSCSFSGCDGCGGFCSGTGGSSCSWSSNGGNECKCADGTSCGGS